MKNRYVAHSILEWSDEQLEKYILDHALEANPLYEEVGTSGCYFCRPERNDDGDGHNPQ